MPPFHLALLSTLLLAGTACRRAPPPEPPVATTRPPVDAAWVAICGGPSQPNCPLESWMEDEMSAPQLSHDWTHLARSHARLAAHAPAAYPRWAEWATAGLHAVQARDRVAMKASCDGCHKAIRDDYRERMGGRPAPPNDHTPTDQRPVTQP
jgi:hypothetical protein